MNEIIFRFTNEQRLRYWFRYVTNFLKDRNSCVKCNIVQKYIELNGIKIWFKIDSHECVVGTYNVNQYWVEDLFDNNFEEFFYQILKENLNG